MTTNTDARQSVRDDVVNKLRAGNDPEQVIDDFMALTEAATQRLATRLQLETLMTAAEELAELAQRRAILESYIAYLIDANGGRIMIDNNLYQRWVDSHPDGGHVANTDGSTEQETVLTVHHGTHADDEDDESFEFVMPVKPTSYVI